MTTAIQVTPPPASAKPAPKVQKEDAMWLQKEMINRNYHEIATAHESGRKVSATFVPGNLNELLMCFDFARNLPETNALHNGMRKKTGKFIMDAERDGHSEDVCTYVKADLGMLLNGEVGPTGEPLPRPDILLLSYTGCFTFMKWFELVRQKYGCETVMLHVPYQSEGRISRNMVDYIVKQLREVVIPTLERVSGVKFDIDRLRQYMKESAKAEDDLVRVFQSAKNRPSPIDGFFGAVYYIGPIFSAFRGTSEATQYYAMLRRKSSSVYATEKAPSPRKASSPRRNTAWLSTARRAGPTSANSGKCSMTRGRWWWHRPMPRLAASTISAFATIRTVPWNRSPNTAWDACQT